MFFRKNLKETIDQIQADITIFVQTELQLYLSNESNNSLSHSVIANIALLDLDSLNSEQGYTQMKRLLGDHYDQMIERRMKQFLHTIYIRYGKADVEDIRKRVVDTMKIAYPKINPANINALNSEYNTFWLVPFIKEAYNTIVLGAKK